MKATELEVGKIYFASTSHDWQYSGWGMDKVRLVDATVAHWYYDHAAKKYQAASGATYRSKKGVLVESLTGNGNVIETKIVTLQAIKGLWDVVNPVVESNRAARKKAENEHREARNAASKAVTENFQWAQVLKVKGIGINGAQNTVSAETLAMLLEVYAKAQVQA